MWVLCGNGIGCSAFDRIAKNARAASPIVRCAGVKTEDDTGARLSAARNERHEQHGQTGSPKGLRYCRTRSAGLQACHRRRPHYFACRLRRKFTMFHISGSVILLL